MSLAAFVLVAIMMVQFEPTICSTVRESIAASTMFHPEAQKDLINFYWSNRQNQSIHMDTNNVNKTEFSSKKSCPTIFIAHGWTHNSKMTWVLDMIQSFLLNSDINVVAVDWQPLAAQFYSQSARSTEEVGTKLGELIAKFKNDLGYNLNNIHIIGHSLGSHVAGFAAKTVMKLCGGEKVARISALDPAGPLFETPICVGCSKRVCITDAHFVDVYHTDGGNFGFVRPIGHVDFYPNNGVAVQPGCEEMGLWLIKEYCSHGRAYDMYDESINNDNFMAMPCKSYQSYKDGYCNTGGVKMGYHVSPDTRGIYYLTTNARTPFAINT